MTVLGEDGFPIPSREKLNDSTFMCVCPICMSANGKMKVAKNGNWQVTCHNCKVVLYLNSVTSINLFRGLQSFLSENPKHQVAHTQGLIRHAPDEGQ